MEFQRIDNHLTIDGLKLTDIIEEFGSPLYLYHERTLREQCGKLKKLSTLDNFKIAYSTKANTNVALMKIVREEGITVDAMTIGEVFLEEQAGYQKDEILFLSNNVSREDFEFVSKRGIRTCVDSLTQLELYCDVNPNSEVYIRLNPGKGDGHHNKVVTAGKVKFGIEWDLADEAFTIAEKSGVTITGFTIHIGSLFLQPDLFHESVLKLLEKVKKYPSVEYIDFGGGIGIPYDRANEGEFPVEKYAEQFDQVLNKWMDETGRKPIFAIEPGRYIVGPAGICLTTVQSKKNNGGIDFVGTDLGFNFLVRPEMYGSFHEILHANPRSLTEIEEVTVVGNVCESGDTIGKQRKLEKTEIGDVLVVRDTGAYGFSMSSNYNSMQKPAEVLIQEDGTLRLIRKRECLEDLLNHQIY